LDKKGNIYDLLNEYLNIGEDSINILEEQIDSDVQLEYFEYSRNFESKDSAEEIFNNRELIFSSDVPDEHKKNILVQLASINDVEAYRTIQKYLRGPNTLLYHWACMALQESRLLLESNLMDENKVLITTGLGGKGFKLRYFIVFFTDDGSPYTQLQKKIIRSELNYSMNKNGAEIEDILFENCFASILAIVPINIPVQQLFDSVIFECNQLGGFLFNDYIITNHKVLSIEEIQEMLAINNVY
jgi:hypothetical protein